MAAGSLSDMLWRRYGRTILISIPIAAAVGALLGFAMYFSGNSDYRSQGGWGTFGYWVTLGAGFGVATALPAILGAVIILALTDHSLTRARTERVKAGGWGAAAGALAVWVVVTALSAPWTSGLTLFLIIGFVAAGISGVAAAVLIRWTETRPRGQQRVGERVSR